MCTYKINSKNKSIKARRTQNLIKKEKENETTEEILEQINLYDRILVVVEEGTEIDYGPNINNLVINNLYEIITNNLLQEKVVISIFKFYYLVKQGYLLKNMYDIVIFRIDEIQKEFCEAFKHFYFSEIEKSIFKVSFNIKKNVVILSYLKKIEKEYSIYLHSRIESDEGNEINENILNQIVVSPKYDPDVEKYISMKILLSSAIKNSGNQEYRDLYDEVVKLEQFSYKMSLHLLKSKINLKNLTSQHFKETLRLKDLEFLSINDFKFRRTLEIIEKENTSIFICCDNEDLLIQLMRIKTQNSNQIFIVNEQSEENIKNLSNSSILIIYDHINIEVASFPFKKIYVFSNIGSSLSKFMEIKMFTNNSSEGNEELNFIKYIRKNDEGYKTENAFIPFNTAFQMLSNFFYLLKKLFDENFLFIKNLGIKSFYSKTANGKFICQIKLPKIIDDEIFSEFHISTEFPTKKDSQRDASLKILIELHKNGFMDGNLFPCREKFITENKLYYSLLVEMYGNKECNPKEDCIRCFRKYPLETRMGKLKEVMKKIMETYANENPYIQIDQLEIAFKKSFGLNLEVELPKLNDVDLCYKIQPACLKKYPEEEYYLYVFDKGKETDFDLGIICGESFEGKVNFKGVEIEFIRKVEVTMEYIDAIFFFQVPFFCLHYKKVAKYATSSKDYCYFVVPVKNGNIDFAYLRSFLDNFLISSVYENKNPEILGTNLIFNPFTKVFYSFKEKCNLSILHPCIPYRNNKYDFNRKDEKEDDEVYASYLDYFEDKYNITLLQKSEDPSLLFRGALYTGKGESRLMSILSSEIMYITSVKNNLSPKFLLFKKYLFAFESVALSYELQKKLNLKISLQKTVQSMLLKSNFGENGGENDYERLEFLGDTILKFVTSKHLFLTKNESLGSVVTEKDMKICNNNLFNISQGLDIPLYFSFTPYCDDMFQPPNLFMFADSCLSSELSESLKEYIGYFNGGHVFKNNSQSSYVSKTQGSTAELTSKKILSKKICADIVEALIGSHFLEFGMQEASNFIYKINILKWEGILPTTNAEIEKMCVYQSVLKEEEIDFIEEILNYKFINKGLIEKALIHPSYSNNIFGSVNFNKLELIGDCTLDVLVAKRNYLKFPELDPFGLHSVKKSMVNNYTLARALFKMNLIPYAHTCFSAEQIDAVKNKLSTDGDSVSKVFSDIFEAIIGAVMIDCKFNFKRIEEIFDTKVCDILVECADTSR